MIVPMSVYTSEGWIVADRDQQPRPDTSMEGLRELKTPFRVQGKVTPGNASGLNDGAAGVILMSADKAAEIGVVPRMRLKGFGYAGVKPEIMGYGPVPATRKALARAGLTMDDIGAIELNEAFAVQCIVFMKEFGLKFPDDERLNPHGRSDSFRPSSCRLRTPAGHAPYEYILRTSGSPLRDYEPLCRSRAGGDGHLGKYKLVTRDS